MPRRPFFELTGERIAGPPPMRRSSAVFRAGIVRTLFRLVVWAWALVLFAGGTLGDLLRGRQSRSRRAIRLRCTLERMGGTFLKLGQQLSIRIDLLPAEICHELSKLLDQVPPFPTEEAVKIVEGAIGGPLAETFSAFDPEPIGSASIACVYQAELRTGERVAVKVRRPGIARTFAADWRALSWVVALFELLTVVRPGQLGHMLDDLQSMFREELDFRKEARATYLFRQRARRSRLDVISAPRVWFDLSTEEVLVTEFVSGVWMWELLDAVESGNPEALAHLASRDIDPAAVARHLFEASLFGIFENLVFHADPHPANVVVRPGGEIVLVDFGSCGTYTERQLTTLRQFNYCHSVEDVGGMVQCVLELMEPLPPVDVDELTRVAEEVFSNSIQAIKSPGSEWWERTSAAVWIAFMGIARRYQIRVDLDILRMVRSTLLYDTIAARLWPEIDIYDEYQRYRRQMAKRARRRITRRWQRLVTRGPDDRAFLRLEELATLGQRLTYRLERVLDSPTYRFSLLAGKAVFAITSLVNWALFALTLGGVGVTVAATRSLLALRPFDFGASLEGVFGHPIYLTVVAAFLAVTIRRILFRLNDREV